MFRVGIQLPHYPIELVIKAGVYADKLGFNSIFTPDHLVGIGLKNFYAYEAFSILGYFAAKTKATLGVCVSDVLRRNPAVVAQAASTIASMSGREFILGLGAGEGMNLLPFGIGTKFMVSKLEEGVRIIRELLSGKVVSYEGKFFRMNGAFVPPSEKVKIWIAGNSQKTMEITAKYADGWIPTATMGERKYEENLKKIVRKHRKVEAGLFAYTVVAKSYDEAREMIEVPGKFIALLSPFRGEFLKKVGIDEKDLPPNILHFTFTKENVEKLLNVAKQIPFELVERRYFYGSPEDVAERMEKFIKAGVEHFVLTPLVRHNYYLECVRLIAEKVLPLLRED